MYKNLPITNRNTRNKCREKRSAGYYHSQRPARVLCYFAAPYAPRLSFFLRSARIPIIEAASTSA